MSMTTFRAEDTLGVFIMSIPLWNLAWVQLSGPNKAPKFPLQLIATGTIKAVIHHQWDAEEAIQKLSLFWKTMYVSKMEWTLNSKRKTEEEKKVLN